MTITGPGGVEVFKTGVNKQGEFHFVAKQRVDYTITVDGGDAHVANYVIHAADLPDTLPTPDDGKICRSTPRAPIAADTAPAAAETPADAASHRRSGDRIDPADAARDDPRERRPEVNPLRAQLDAFQEQVGWRDVVSGIGYIFGLCGVAYVFANRNRRAPSGQDRGGEDVTRRRRSKRSKSPAASGGLAAERGHILQHAIGEEAQASSS